MRTPKEKMKRKGRCPQCKSEKLFVSVYRGNWSAFNGYRRQYSDYSEITCDACGHSWRTKAKYVEDLPKARGSKA
jgi:transcription elongation factor Elf1